MILFTSGCAGIIDQPDTAVSTSRAAEPAKTIRSSFNSSTKRIHLAVKLISMSRTDAKRLDLEGTRHNWAFGSKLCFELGVRCNLASTELQSLLNYLRHQTKARFEQLPQKVLRNEEVFTAAAGPTERHRTHATGDV
jgi:hypothetical protein